MGIAKFVRANTVCFLDWDDTLMFTSQIRQLHEAPEGWAVPSMSDAMVEADKMATLDRTITRTLRKFAAVSAVKIVSNAELDWVLESCNQHFPMTKRTIQHFGIDVMSARDLYSENLEDRPVEWKARCFYDQLQKCLDLTMPRINVVVVGDDAVDILAAEALQQRLPEAVVKTVKFVESPTIDEIQRQMSLLNIHFPRILSHNESIVIGLMQRAPRAARVEPQRVPPAQVC